jgi:vacuolar protein sorting-associated protein 72
MSDLDSDDSDFPVSKPPERREASSRAGRGNRMSRLIAEEGDEEEEDDADKDFYNQGFWADEEQDDDFAADADDEEGVDSFDSDFGDSSASEDEGDDDGEEKAARKKPKKKGHGVYKDPKLARKKGEAAGEGSSAGVQAKPSHKKRPRTEGEGLVLPPIARSRDSMRGSTQAASQHAQERRKSLEAEQKARAERAAQTGFRRGNVELRRLTQAEILAEAAQTEIINRASLERMLRIEEEKRRVVVRERVTDGPRIKYHSKRNGDEVVNTITFVDAPVPSCIDGIAPPYPAPQRCAVTHQPAKYLDPVTGNAYATLEAFRVLRGRGGRRQQSFGNPAATPAGPSTDD